MNASLLLKFIRSLPETVRSVLYVVYLLIYFIKSMKTFFVPKRPRFVPEDQLTSFPRETPDGIVHEVMSDSDVINRFSAPDALSFDPANLVNNGIEPQSFGGSVVSPLDAVDRLVESFESIDTSLITDSSSDSSSNDSSVSGSSEVNS